MIRRSRGRKISLRFDVDQLRRCGAFAVIAAAIVASECMGGDPKRGATVVQSGLVAQEIHSGRGPPARERGVDGRASHFGPIPARDVDGGSILEGAPPLGSRVGHRLALDPA